MTAVFFLVLATAPAAHAIDVAKVNGKAITDRDVHAALSNLNEGQRKTALKDATNRWQVVSSVVDQELLVQEGEKEKLDQDQEYKDALNAFRRQFLASRVLQKNLGSKLTDSSAKKYYNSNKDRFSTDQVHAMHVLIRDEKRAIAAAKALAGKADDDFKDYAEKNSEDPSAKNNRGDLGYFGRDRMAAEFSDAAFGGSKGELVGPIKSLYGYHIIKIVDKKVGKPLEYDEVELRVKNELRQNLTQGYVGGLKKQAKVEIDEKAVGKL